MNETAETGGRDFMRQSVADDLAAGQHRKATLVQAKPET